jgi:type II secretory pathway pseudopilin PulG
MFGILKISDTFPLRSGRGFTLVEAVITTGIITILAGATFGVIGVQKSAKFDSQSQELLGSLRDMQSKSRSVEGNREYGVSFSGNSWTTFSRDPASQAVTNLRTTTLSSATLTTAIVPNATQVVFTRLTGQPTNSTSATLTLNMTNPTKQRVLKVESAGAIYVQ